MVQLISYKFLQYWFRWPRDLSCESIFWRFVPCFFMIISSVIIHAINTFAHCKTQKIWSKAKRGGVFLKLLGYLCNISNQCLTYTWVLNRKIWIWKWTELKCIIQLQMTLGCPMLLLSGIYFCTVCQARHCALKPPFFNNHAISRMFNSQNLIYLNYLDEDI